MGTVTLVHDLCVERATNVQFTDYYIDSMMDEGFDTTTFGGYDYMQVGLSSKAGDERRIIALYDMNPAIPKMVKTDSGSLTDEAVDIGETDFKVDDGTDFAVGEYISIDDEVMLVTAIAADTLTVTLAQLGTADAAHADDTTIYILSGAIVTAAVWYLYITVNSLLENDVHVHRINRCTRADWTERYVTWNNYEHDTPWTIPGGDFSLPYLVTATLDFTTGVSVWWTTNVLPFVTDARLNRSDKLNMIFARNATDLTNDGYVQFSTKYAELLDPFLPQAPHVRITYTLDDKTFQVMAR